MSIPLGELYGIWRRPEPGLTDQAPLPPMEVRDRETHHRDGEQRAHRFRGRWRSSISSGGTCTASTTTCAGRSLVPTVTRRGTWSGFGARLVTSRITTWTSAMARASPRCSSAIVLTSSFIARPSPPTTWPRVVTTSTRTTSTRRLSSSTGRRDRPPSTISAAVAPTASRSSGDRALPGPPWQDPHRGIRGDQSSRRSHYLH